jgi:hypothetical protein
MQSLAAKSEPQGAPAKGATATTAPPHAEKPETRTPAARAPIAPPDSPAQTPQSVGAEVRLEPKGEQTAPPAVAQGVAKPAGAPYVTPAASSEKTEDGREGLFDGLDALDGLEEEMARLLGRENFK